MKRSYPITGTISRFVRWSLTTLGNTFFGIGGTLLLIIIVLYVAGALIEPARWYLVGIASVLFLLCGGLLALFYVRSLLNSFVREQRLQVSDTKKKLWDVNKRVSDTSKQVSDIKKALDISGATLGKTNVSNFASFQPFNRTLTNKDLKRFTEEWVPKLGLDLDVKALAYMAHHICLAEDTCVGRLAGDIGDMLLRILIARSVNERELSILEIGTLFGVSIAIVYENCRDFFNSVHITVIDPLQGYYEKSFDPVTMMPVTRDRFVSNMERMHIPKSDYTVIQKLSSEGEAIEQASTRRYNMLIIDGDHSYSGVKQDFRNYKHLVKPGGYIIFDNYNDPKWPGLKDFVDKEVVGLPELEFLGSDMITAVFRVISTKD